MARGWIWILLIADDEEEDEDDTTPSADPTTTGGESTSMVGLDWILDIGCQNARMPAETAGRQSDEFPKNKFVCPWTTLPPYIFFGGRESWERIGKGDDVRQIRHSSEY